MDILHFIHRVNSIFWLFLCHVLAVRGFTPVCTEFQTDRIKDILGMPISGPGASDNAGQDLVIYRESSQTSPPARTDPPATVQYEYTYDNV